MLESMLHQSFEQIEIICVDDGSTDGSAEIIKTFSQKDNRIKYVFQENQGGGTARNTGIERASGKYIICLDADDEYENDMLAILFDRAEKTGADITFCTYKINNLQTGKISRNKGVNYKLLPQKETFSRKDVSDIFNITNPGPANKLYKTEFVKSKNLKYSATKSTNDMAFTLTALALAEKITFVDKELTTYRFLSPVSGSTKREKYSYQCVTSFREIYKVLKDNGLYEELKSTYIKRIINSITYECAFPIGEKYITAIPKFLSEEPFCEIDRKELKKMFKINKIQKRYIEYFLLTLLTLGLNKSIKKHRDDKKLVLHNIKSLGLTP